MTLLQNLPEPPRSVMTAAMEPSGHSHPVKAQAYRVAAALRVVIGEVIPDDVDRPVSAEEIREKFNQLVDYLHCLEGKVVDLQRHLDRIEEYEMEQGDR